MTEMGETVIELHPKIQEVQDHEEFTHRLPQENTRSTYTPKIISIGPLHNGKLEPKEDLKQKYLVKLLNAELLEELSMEAIKWKDEVLGRYEELSSVISEKGLAKLLVTDGCFLLEFLSNNKGDNFGWRQRQPIDHDILLFENQIPFFVLKRLYDTLRKKGNYSDADPNLEKVAYHYLNHMNKVTNNRTFLRDGLINETNEMSEPSNLLHLYHMMLFSKNHQPHHPTSTIFIRKWTMALFSGLFVIVSYPMYFIHKIFFADITYPTKLISATEIEEAGVRLQGSRMDLRFEQGTLLIPVLTLNQQSLCLLKNLMVFEFYFRSLVRPYVHTYVFFLSLLIKNPGDLKVMEKHHIIITGGGGDESFALVNELIQAGFEELKLDEADEIESGLKTHCDKPHHRWRAKLMKDYFGNPWSILGLLAGVILLGLATIQTVLNLLKYHDQQIGG